MIPPSPRWPLHDAKVRFSEVVRRALANGPQFVTCNGESAVVIVAAAEYDHLHVPAGQSFARMLAASPLSDVSLDIARPRKYTA